jgi:hypothetical protein
MEYRQETQSFHRQRHHDTLRTELHAGQRKDKYNRHSRYLSNEQEME